jgi:magnesium transporter
VVDEQGRLVGVVRLRSLILADPRRTIAEIMNPDVISVSPLADQEEVAELFSRYNLVALPVVDETGRLLGIVRVEDILDVIEEEATEDIYRLAGMDEEADLFSPLSHAINTRLSWLLVNLMTAFAASAVVSQFENVIAQVAVLATFMPIIAGQGGNAGIQTSTIFIRSLAMGRLELNEVWKALRYELLLGLVNGLAIGLIVAIVAVIWKGMPMLGVVIGLAMIGNMLVAAFAGVIIPFFLQWRGHDPALASGIFLTTATDVCGFFFFLGLGSLLLL